MKIKVKKAIKLIISDKKGLSNLRKQSHPLMIQINERISSLIRDNILVDINGSYNDVYIYRETLPFVFKPKEVQGEKLTTSNFMKEFMSDIFSPYEKSKVTTQLRMFTAGQLRKYKGYKKRNKGKLPNFVAVRSDNLVMGDGFFEFYKNKINGKLKVKNLDGTKSIVRYRKSSKCKGIQNNALKYIEYADTEKKFGGTIVFGKEGQPDRIVASVDVPVEFDYYPKGFIGLDFNKSNKNWIYFSEDIFGQEKISKESYPVISALEKFIESRNKIVKVHKDISEREVRTKQRTPIRLEIKKLHKKHMDLIETSRFPGKERAIIDSILDYAISKSYGLAIDTVATGDKNGTFGQDKLKQLFIDKCIERKVPYILAPSYYTSRRCIHCGWLDLSEANSSRDKKTNIFTCEHCDKTENADRTGAKNHVVYAKHLADIDFWTFNKSKQWAKIKESENIFHSSQINDR